MILRAGIAAVIAAMFLLLAALSTGPGGAVQTARAMQDETDYPYPFEFETDIFEDFEEYPLDETGFPFDEETPSDFDTAEPLALTQTMAPTQPPNTFLTESAEMSGGQVTPPPSATPQPTITVYVSPTAPTRTLRPTSVSAGGVGGGGPVNWGYFSLGFALPVLAGCGYVLYLLDRRPDLFRRRS